MGFYDFYKTYTLRKKILTKSVSPPPEKSQPPPFASPPPPPPRKFEIILPPPISKFSKFPAPPLQRGGRTLCWATPFIKPESTFAEETFASGKIREIFGRNFREFRELANFGFSRELSFANSCFNSFFLVCFYSYCALIRSFTVYIRFLGFLTFASLKLFFSRE